MIIDHCHNPGGLSASSELINKLKTNGRNICVMTTPSNRKDEHFVAMAEIAAKSFDHVVCSNWYELRNNPPEKVPDAFAKALRNCGYPEENITIANEPDQSIRTAVQMLKAGDFLIISGDRAERRRKLALKTLQEED